MRRLFWAAAAAFVMLHPLSSMAEERLPPAVLASPQDIALRPGRALMAATIIRLSTPLAEDRRLRFTCAVWMPRGAPTDCLPASARIPRDWTKFREESLKFQASALDGVTRAALDRILFTRLKSSDQTDSPNHKLFIFDETVSPDDRLGELPTAEHLPADAVTIIQRPDPQVMSALYPERAVRRGLGVRVVALCRVEPDQRLLCRNAKVLGDGWPDWADERMAREFEYATYQLSSEIKVADNLTDGRSSAGVDVEMSFNWAAPVP
jgi:hypothetical protein